MEIVLKVVRPLLFFLLLQGLIQNILPQGNFQKLFRICMGMVFLLLVLRPVYTFLREDDFNTMLNNLQSQQAVREYEEKVGQVSEWINEKYTKNYQEFLQKSVEEIVQAQGFLMTDCEVRVGTDGTLEELEVTVSSGGVREIQVQVVTEKEIESPQALKIKNEIMELYELGEESIIIREVK